MIGEFFECLFIGLGNGQKEDESAPEKIAEVEKKPGGKQPEEVKSKEQEEVPLVPLEDVKPKANDTPVVSNEPYSENETEIPQVLLKKLTVNETEENPYKLGGETQESKLIFAYEKEHGFNRSAMFGGDILLSADIVEELSNYMQRQTDAASPQEIKVGLHPYFSGDESLTH